MKQLARNNKKSNVLITVLIVLFCILFLVSAFFIYRHYRDVRNNKEEYEDLSQLVQQVEPQEDTTGKSEYDFSELLKKNSDFVGWIKIPNTGVNHPVVKTKDNNFYLNHDFNKNYTVRGAIYMDYRNNVDLSDNNTIIYGHNCYDGTMFSDLDKFDKIEYYKKAPYFEYITNDGAEYYKIYGVFITSAKESEDNGYIFYYNNPKPEKYDYKGFIDEIDKRRIYTTDVDINENDKIMILSTCTRKMDLYNGFGKKTYKADGRIVVVGRMLRNGESRDIDVEKAKYNNNPKYPQIWYDKKKTDNPYKNDKGWYPKREEKQ